MQTYPKAIIPLLSLKPACWNMKRKYSEKKSTLFLFKIKSRKYILVFIII